MHTHSEGSEVNRSLIDDWSFTEDLSPFRIRQHNPKPLKIVADGNSPLWFRENRTYARGARDSSREGGRRNPTCTVEIFMYQAPPRDRSPIAFCTPTCRLSIDTSAYVVYVFLCIRVIVATSSSDLPTKMLRITCSTRNVSHERREEPNYCIKALIVDPRSPCSWESVPAINGTVDQSKNEKRSRCTRTMVRCCATIPTAVRWHEQPPTTRTCTASQAPVSPSPLPASPPCPPVQASSTPTPPPTPPLPLAATGWSVCARRKAVSLPLALMPYSRDSFLLPHCWSCCCCC